MKPKKAHIILTCEHADNKIPDFVSSKMPSWYNNSVKNGHQAYDRYALEISKEIELVLKENGFSVDLISYPFTRLLIDANRTKDNKGFYSKLSPYTTNEELKKIEQHYDDYKLKCENLIKKKLTAKHRVLIFSVHSFTPIFKGKKRRTDIGLLFRNYISSERNFAITLKKKLKADVVKTHLNLPYRGHTDCFLNNILDGFKKRNVNGLFFEFNQNFLKSNIKKKANTVANALLSTIRTHDHEML